MPKFFAPHENICGDTAEICGADAAHIVRVLRMREGERLILCDGAGTDYDCIITSADPDRISLKIENQTMCEAEPSVDITLFMALPKSDKMEYVIQKSVELGVKKIVPFCASRCVVKLSGKDVARKVERWQKIAYAAAKQSGRGIIPQVTEPISVKEMCAKAQDFDLPLFCYECEEENSLKSALSKAEFKTACVVVGPEGGFDIDEVEQAKKVGFNIVSLGKRILRCETAPGCAICAILYHTDNL